MRSTAHSLQQHLLDPKKIHSDSRTTLPHVSGGTPIDHSAIGMRRRAQGDEQGMWAGISHEE